MDEKDILINRLKDAIKQLITLMQDYCKEISDGLENNSINRSEDYKLKCCVVCEKCQSKANNDEQVKESSGT
jgi:multimeric flavodoxin WrbA